MHGREKRATGIEVENPSGGKEQESARGNLARLGGEKARNPSMRIKQDSAKGIIIYDFASMRFWLKSVMNDS